MPPCGSDGSLPSRPQWTALFDLFDIVLSVFECMCIFSLFYLNTRGITLRECVRVRSVRIGRLNYILSLCSRATLLYIV